MKLLKQGNAKLDKSIAVFNLPAVFTCGRECPGCYALKAEKRFPAVKKARLRNYIISTEDAFVDMVTNELANLGPRIRAVRVHESGDFYSEAYVAKWARIAERFPGLTFYAYTKRRGQDIRNGSAFAIADALAGLEAMPNFVLIDSLQYGNVNYGTITELAGRECQGAFICPCGTPEDDKAKAEGRKICGTTCTYCQTKAAQNRAPVFIKH